MNVHEINHGRPLRQKKIQRYKVFCEGYTEKWYFEKILNPTHFKIEKAKSSNAEMLVNEVVNNINGVGKAKSKFDKCFNCHFCVYDKDKKSNTPEQLTNIGTIIRQNSDKMIRVFSNPCFEVVFLSHFRATSKSFNDVTHVEKELSKILQNEYKISYSKSQKCIEAIIEAFGNEFDTIRTNSRKMHKSAQTIEPNLVSEPDDAYYHNTNYCYSEIYKILELGCN